MQSNADQGAPSSAWRHTGFIRGANLPWLVYGSDFGANAWYPNGGVARPEQTRKLDDTCRRLGDHGITALRWFAFCDLRSGVRFDSAGTPEELDERVFPDMEAALSTLDRYNLKVIFSLFDYYLCARRRFESGVQTGGRRGLVSDPDRRRALVERIVVPLLERFGDADGVLAWEVMNEPEWVTSGYGSPILGVRVSRREMRAFLRSVIEAIHGSSSRPVTVGCASRRWLGLVEDLEIDLPQVHWYDKIDSIDALRHPVANWAAGVPVLLGEFPTKGSAHDAATLARAAHAAGFAGAFAWSALGADEASDGAIVDVLYENLATSRPGYRVV